MCLTYCTDATIVSSHAGSSGVVNCNIIKFYFVLLRILEAELEAERRNHEIETEELKARFLGTLKVCSALVWSC